LGKNLEKYIDRARETLKKKNIINPKSTKRFAKLVESEDEDPAENAKPEFRTPAIPMRAVNENVTINLEESQLRPVRSAKINASKNLVRSHLNLPLNPPNPTANTLTERTSIES
jgi:hypothetical protein